MNEITDPEWAEILESFGARLLEGVHTSMPGIVRSYDEATQLAEIQPAIRWRDKDIPPLKDVPIAHPSGGGYALTFPLAAGDAVQLVFEEVDSALWHESETVSDPATLRRHGWSAWAVPVRRPKTQAPFEAGKWVLSKGSMRVAVDASLVSLAGGLAFLARADILATYLSSLETALNGLSPGSGTALAALRTNLATTKVKAT